MERTNGQLALELASKMQQQEKLNNNKSDLLQRRVADAVVNLLEQQEQLQDTERTNSYLDAETAVLPEKDLVRACARVQLVDEETFSANEDEETC